MKSLYIAAALSLVLAGCMGPAHHAGSSGSARPMRLVITGPESQPFTGNYVADGVTNSVSATAPTTIYLDARDVTYEFKRDSDQGEFRVALFVRDLCRTSITSTPGQGVRGWLHYSPNGERYGGEAF